LACQNIARICLCWFTRLVRVRLAYTNILSRRRTNGPPTARRRRGSARPLWRRFAPGNWIPRIDAPAGTIKVKAVLRRFEETCICRLYSHCSSCVLKVRRCGIRCSPQMCGRLVAHRTNGVLQQRISRYERRLVLRLLGLTTSEQRSTSCHHSPTSE
jgi:hypothetical protein